MSERRQLNVRLDKEPELYEAIRDQAHRLDVSISTFMIMALKSALDWQIPFDAPTLLRRIQALEKTVRDLTFWKEMVELEKVQQHNDYMIELDNLRRRLIILENVHELKHLKEELVPELRALAEVFKSQIKE